VQLPLFPVVTGKRDSGVLSGRQLGRLTASANQPFAGTPTLTFMPPECHTAGAGRAVPRGCAGPGVGNIGLWESCGDGKLCITLHSSRQTDGVRPGNIHSVGSPIPEPWPRLDRMREISTACRRHAATDRRYNVEI
jgi:hypothetical protein